MKIAYCGFDLFYKCLEKIQENNHQILKIFTVNTDNVYEFSDEVTNFANKNNIPYTKNRITQEDIEELIQQGCELIVSAGYHYKIPISQNPNELIQGINLHPALLPIGRGAWPMPLTILKKIDTTGVTVHKLAKNFDEGDILKATEFHVLENDNLETLIEKYHEKGAKLLVEVLENLEYYWTNSSPQETGEYWKEPTNEDRTFTAGTEIDEIELIIKAFWGFGSILKLAKEEVIIKYGKCIKSDHMCRYGEVVDVPEYGNCYAVNGGYLMIIC